MAHKFRTLDALLDGISDASDPQQNWLTDREAELRMEGYTAQAAKSKALSDWSTYYSESIQQGGVMKKRIGDREAKHLYDVETQLVGGGREVIEVDADTRTQARKVAEDAGYEVCSVNMVG